MSKRDTPKKCREDLLAFIDSRFGDVTVVETVILLRAVADSLVTAVAKYETENE
jgi:hypothetical protein